ncbi:hypothetical protein OE88DRAFT_1647297 [Heliocybe sulcata]|uniref:Uncharacterized protein n=1 Tax=Heliocybe sulcata TaxID=5364 RepID=A0A5C3N3G7_9AGAM|nr:hypothetical protein OE88DRAFT_1647297 [Heliocybe sulcata]
MSMHNSYECLRATDWRDTTYSSMQDWARVSCISPALILLGDGRVGEAIWDIGSEGRDETQEHDFQIGTREIQHSRACKIGLGYLVSLRTFKSGPEGYNIPEHARLGSGILYPSGFDGFGDGARGCVREWDGSGRDEGAERASKGTRERTRTRDGIRAAQNGWTDSGEENVGEERHSGEEQERMTWRKIGLRVGIGGIQHTRACKIGLGYLDLGVGTGGIQHTRACKIGLGYLVSLWFRWLSWIDGETREEESGRAREAEDVCGQKGRDGRREEEKGGGVKREGERTGTAGEHKRRDCRTLTSKSRSEGYNISKHARLGLAILYLSGFDDFRGLIGRVRAEKEEESETGGLQHIPACKIGLGYLVSLRLRSLLGDDDERMWEAGQEESERRDWEERNRDRRVTTYPSVQDWAWDGRSGRVCQRVRTRVAEDKRGSGVMRGREGREEQWKGGYVVGEREELEITEEAEAERNGKRGTGDVGGDRES